MDWQATAKILAMAMSAIDKLASNASDEAQGQRPAEALASIARIVATVKAGNLDNLEPSRAFDELQVLLSLISNNDESTDTAVDQKFGNSN